MSNSETDGSSDTRGIRLMIEEASKDASSTTTVLRTVRFFIGNIVSIIDGIDGIDDIDGIRSLKSTECRFASGQIYVLCGGGCRTHVEATMGSSK
jgi:hypothetical protein